MHPWYQRDPIDGTNGTDSRSVRPAPVAPETAETASEIDRPNRSDQRDDRDQPLRIALVNDYEVIVRGVAAMLQPFGDRVQVVELEVGGVAEESVDIALFDTFGGHRTILRRAQAMVADREVDHVVLYTWSADANLLAIARASGVSGVLSKAVTAVQLVDGLERIARGEELGFDTPLRLAGHQGHLANIGRRPSSTATGADRLDRPDQRPAPAIDLRTDLTAREQEVLAMLGLGLSNRDIADELFLGVETVRTYVRQVFQKLGVKNRTQAAVRARVLGLEPAAERRPAAS
jgi:DNA-binding NarL/FixJ family response regulator